MDPKVIMCMLCGEMHECFKYFDMTLVACPLLDDAPTGTFVNTTALKRTIQEINTGQRPSPLVWLNFPVHLSC